MVAAGKKRLAAVGQVMVGGGEEEGQDRVAGDVVDAEAVAADAGKVADAQNLELEDF